MRAVLVAVVALLLCACGSASERPDASPAADVKPELPEPLEAELEAIRADPGESVGFGEKAYIPYEPNVARFLISHDDPAVTQRLLAEMSAADRVHRLALLHVLGQRADDTVDNALLTTLEDPELRATSAYLLGRAGYRGYPRRSRDVEEIRDALRQHLEDESTFEDPFYHRSFNVGDFVLAAYVRLTGPDRFDFAEPNLAHLIGYELPRFDSATRADLLAQVERLRD